MSWGQDLGTSTPHPPKPKRQSSSGEQAKAHNHRSKPRNRKHKPGKHLPAGWRATIPTLVPVTNACVRGWQDLGGDVMARALKICALNGCPRVTDGRYCTPHQAAHDKARGTTSQRGYGANFQATRREYADEHKHRDLTCWRCGEPIPQGTMFHLGHKDDDRDVIMGPEHPLCNLEAAGRSSHRFD